MLYVRETKPPVALAGALADPAIGLKRALEDAFEGRFAAALQRFGSLHAAPSS